jgi:UDP-N-acetylglucosamine 1-carboxyvinyltransferase
MDAFIIEGGRPLRGTVEVRGAKNAALPMMAAALLLDDGKLVLRRVPNLADIKQMALVLQELGVRIDRRGDEMTLQVVSDKNCRASYELVSKMRASVCVLGPLVGKRRHAEVSMPGGCSIGDRPTRNPTPGGTRAYSSRKSLPRTGAWRGSRPSS